MMVFIPSGSSSRLCKRTGKNKDTGFSAGHEIHHLEKATAPFKGRKKYEILGKTKQEIIERYGM